MRFFAAGVSYFIFLPAASAAETATMLIDMMIQVCKNSSCILKLSI